MIRHTRRQVCGVIGLAALVALSGCAGVLGGSATRGVPAAETMTQSRMEFLFAEHVDAIVGPPGTIQTRVDGINIYLISNPEIDRMRIIAPIAMVESLDPRVLRILLRANFASTLDARYAISEGIIYAAFLHPMSSLTPDLIESALFQVVSLVKTFGTSFTSQPLVQGDASERDR